MQLSDRTRGGSSDMRDSELLLELLAAEHENDAIYVLQKRGLFGAANTKRWVALGGMANNQSVVHAQQSTSAAALVEKFTNGLDAILLRRCKAAGIDPRSAKAPASMSKAMQNWFGDLSEKPAAEIRTLAEENIVLYATGSKSRPCLSIYDAGEGQLPENFPSTFCSLIYASDEGAYKGAVPFVQGRFNMGGTGVLPFCGDDRKMQLIVSRVPSDVEKSPHEWAFTIFCFFSSKQSPSWKYLVGPDHEVLTAGSDPLGLAPKTGAKSGEVCAPRGRKVPHGTLIKMYDYKAPRSNICGELFRKLEDYLLQPKMPLRLIECRPEYKANVMGVTVWDRFAAWEARGKFEEGFEEGASIQIKLSTGEIIPAEVRVFKADDEVSDDVERPQTGLRALINGQSHARRDTQFFKGKAVDKEHIGGSMLVTLDCSDLGQTSRNALFMSNRETFREDPLLNELFKKLQNELKNHEGLIALDEKRYLEKIANATTDDDGVSALEELLSSDPTLANMFGSMIQGKVAARMVEAAMAGLKVKGKAPKFQGTEFPSYFRRKDGSTAIEIEMPQNDETRVSFLTDVKNNYFTRARNKGKCEFAGSIEPTFRLFNGRLTFTYHPDKHKKPVGAVFETSVTISDGAHGPWELSIKVKIGPPREKRENEPPEPNPKTDAAPSRPDIIDVHNGPEASPITVDRVPGTTHLQLQVNVESRLLSEAKLMRLPTEAGAVEFVFKYGLALIAMGLIDSAKKTTEWNTNEVECREQISRVAAGVARVIVPLCLTLPKKLPKAA
jgi:hypothetical protein